MDEGKNKRLIVKLVCVFLSFSLWLYVSNVENPTRTSEIKGVPVEILNEDILKDSNLCISPDQTFTVDLKLEGPANDIYSAKKDDFSIKLDLSSYALKVGENNVPVQVERSPEGLVVKNLALLTIKINVENKIEKEVKLFSKVKTSFKSGFTQNTSSIEPSEVTVSGPESCVNKVSKVALIGEVDNISNNISDKFKLSPVDSEGNEVKGVTINKDEATLHIDVAMQKEVLINPTYSGALSGEDSLESVTLSKNKVVIKGKYEDISYLTTINTNPIDLSSVTSNTSVKVTLQLPEGVTLGSNEALTANIKIKDKSSQTTNEETPIISENTTKKISDIAVKLDNKPDNNYTYTAEKVSIEISGPKSDLDSITLDNIVATASIAEITEIGDFEVTLSITLPNTYSNVTILSKPEKVKVNVK